MPLFKRRPGIAVIEMHGVIGAAVREPDYSRLLERVASNRKIGALVLDIDSPGGSATASDLLYENVRRVAQRKPVVAYIRGLGASGGYYIACGAGTIMASRAALVGSIGVIYLRPIVEQMLSKLGIEMSVFKAGRLKDMSGFWRHPTGEESDKFQGLISSMYDLFVSVVTDNRNLTDEQVRELATGEIYTAAAAQEYRLIDRQGGFNDAVAEAMRLSGARLKIRRLRPKRPFMERVTPFGRSSRQWEAFAGILSLASGGIYFLEPGFLGQGITDSNLQ
jgi:protease-4